MWVVVLCEIVSLRSMKSKLKPLNRYERCFVVEYGRCCLLTSSTMLVGLVLGLEGGRGRCLMLILYGDCWLRGR